MRTIAAAAALLALAACSAPEAPPAPAADAPAAWRVVGEQSRVSFVSVKAGAVAEVHHFGRVEGLVTPEGAATVEIPLETVETKIDIRNERMRDILFETKLYPQATVTAQIDLAAFADLAPGAQSTAPLAGELDLHGVKAPFEATVFVTRAGPDRVSVTTAEPIVIDATAFNLGPGLAELQKLANLSSITPATPVTFTLMFAREG